MSKVAVVVLADLEEGGLGLPSAIDHSLDGRPVLAWTLDRARQVRSASQCAIVYPSTQDEARIIGLAGEAGAKCPLFPFERVEDSYKPSRLMTRRWSMRHWRGGLGGACIFDELLPAKPLLDAADHLKVDALLVVRGDWCLMDPAISDAVIERYRTAPDHFGMVFTQAPPGLCGMLIRRDVIENLVKEPSGTVGSMLTFRPASGRGDPIGLDVCVHIDAQVRSNTERWIYDAARGREQIERLIAARPEDWSKLSTLELARVHRGVALNHPPRAPSHVTFELTTRRRVRGIAAGLYDSTPSEAEQLLEAAPIEASPRVIERILTELARIPDAVLVLGGRGDPLLHSDVGGVIERARRLGLTRIGIETDLLDIEPGRLEQLIELAPDVVLVRLNADRAGTYTQMAGVDRFAEAMGGLEKLVKLRNQAWNAGRLDRGVPWIVPRCIRVRDTMADIEHFFDRWTHYLGHAVIDPAPVRFEDGDVHGWDEIERGGVIHVSPPESVRLASATDRLTVLADGSLPLWSPTGPCRPAISLLKSSFSAAWPDLVSARHQACRAAAEPICRVA
ncbi:MAG: hypothetical protein JJU36_02950 [Phycisphaeraceae bacterium]|nr:hypothetical protein [Phycisphaeraceae bacterium]